MNIILQHRAQISASFGFTTEQQMLRANILTKPGQFDPSLIGKIGDT